MRILKLTLGLLLMTASTVLAQSKLTYTLLINESYPHNNQQQIIINVPAANTSFNLDKSWETSFSFNTNLELNSKWRLQAGIGYNVQSLRNLNSTLATSRYKVEFLSIPMRAHYFIVNKKLRVYTGAGIRTDIRLNESIPYSSPDYVADNARAVAMSLEALVGLEVPITSGLWFNLEPTYATALTRYTQDIGVDVGLNFRTDSQPYTIIDVFPRRIGLSFGLTARF